MTRVIFVDGRGPHGVEAPEGERLLDVARAHGLPLEGTCNGDMACATCHVVVAAEDFDRLPRASAEEEDLLDLVPHAARTSRLACQIRIDGSLAMLTVRIPADRGAA